TRRASPSQSRCTTTPRAPRSTCESPRTPPGRRRASACTFAPPSAPPTRTARPAAPPSARATNAPSPTPAPPAAARVQILYADAFHLDGGDREVQNDHVMSCVEFLRSHPIYRQAGLVYIPENAPGSRGGELAYQLRNVADSVTLAQYGRD